MRKLLSVVLAGAMALSMTACSSKPAETTAAPAETSEAAAEAVTEAVSSEAKEGGYTIGFSPYTLTNEYFTAVLNGVQTACDELGCELIYFDPQNDPTKQASQIDDMIASGINALVYIPYDSAGAQPVLQTCKDAGVKVINVDNVIQEEDYDLVDGIIASDNTQLGYLSGQWVAEHHPDGANILIVHLQTAESCIINVDGFWQGIKENVKNPDAFVEVLCNQRYVGLRRSTGCGRSRQDRLHRYSRKRRRSNRKACNQRRHNGSKLCPEAYIHGIYGSQRGG